jgi:asparagine synthase (glutamine-hydrolysing)
MLVAFHCYTMGMCGIAGVVDPSGMLRDAPVSLHEMVDRLAHRGPDDRGVWWRADLRIGLAHRRLSILDVSPAGHQPMVSACGRWVIAFNGEVYGFEGLRRELDSRRFTPWRGHSDTEVVLECIAQDGFERTVARLSGMFAIAAIDTQGHRLWLASDRAGKKPLYFGWTDGVFVFGSELKALAALGPMPPVDPDAAGMMLRYGYVPAPWSIRRGILKLPQASIAELDLRSVEPGRCPSPRAYWSIGGLADATAQARRSGRVDAAGLEQVLEAAVRRRLVSDVPVGAFLSGGVDSSLVCAMMVRAAQGRVRTFSIGFEDAGLDESRHAARVAAALGTDHVCHRISDADMLAVVPSLPTMFDEPFSDSSQIPTYLVSRVARQHVTVVLSGDGGDEVFGGYGRYRLALESWRKLGRVPLPVRAASAAALRAAAPAIGWLDRAAGLSSRAGFGRLRALLRSPDGIAEIAASPGFAEFYSRTVSTWHSSPVIGGEGAGRRPDPITDSSIDLRALGPRAWMMATDFATYMHGDILVKVDRASMAESLEVRCPFLDSEVVDFAWSLPDELRIGSRGLKVVLHDLARRLVPPEVVDRPKMGFGVPLARWLRGPLRLWMQDLLDPGMLRRHGLLDPAAVDESVRALLAGHDAEQGRVWAAASLTAWAERWTSE